MPFTSGSAQIDPQGNLAGHRQDQHGIAMVMAMMTVRTIFRVDVMVTVFADFTQGMAVFVLGGTMGMPTGAGTRMVRAAVADAHVVTMIAMETTSLELFASVTSVIELVTARIGLSHIGDGAECQAGPEDGGQTKLGHQTILAAAVIGILTDCFHDEYLSFGEHLVRASLLTVRPVSVRPSTLSAGLYLKA